MIFFKSRRIKALEENLTDLKGLVYELRDRLDAVCPGAFDVSSPFKGEQETLFRTHSEKRQEWYKAQQKKKQNETPETGNVG